MALPDQIDSTPLLLNDTSSVATESKRVWVPRPDGTYELADVQEVPPGALDFSHWNGIQLR